MNIKKYIFDKLILPKVITINKPGIIYNVVDSKYSKKKNKKRFIWYFEDNIAALQKETAKRFGKKETKKLWYKIGKKVTLRYMIFSEMKRPPSFLRPIILEYILKKGQSGGISLSENIKYDKKETLILEGRNNVICRKSDIHEYFSGCMSMLLSFLVGKNIESEVDCRECPKRCKIIVSPKIKNKFIPNEEELRISKDYRKLNFKIKEVTPSKNNSFDSLLKFKQIWIDDSGKFCFKGKTILPMEIGGINLICEEYVKENKKEVLEESLKLESEKIAREILRQNLTEKEKLNAINSILSAFGWGIPYFRKEEDKIKFILKNAAYSKYPPLYQINIVNGFLEHIFKEKFELEELKTKSHPYTIILNYKKIKNR